MFRKSERNPGWYRAKRREKAMHDLLWSVLVLGTGLMLAFVILEIRLS